jgi:hypothetical protein
VKVAQGSTCSGYDLLELFLLLLLLVPKAVLLLVVALAIVVLVGVVILIRGVNLLPLGAVNDEVGGVTALEAAPRLSPSLLAELVYGAELSRQQGNLIVWDALILFIISCSQRGQGKLQSR